MWASPWEVRTMQGTRGGFVAASTCSTYDSWATRGYKPAARTAFKMDSRAGDGTLAVRSGFAALMRSLNAVDRHRELHEWTMSVSDITKPASFTIRISSFDAFCTQEPTHVHIIHSFVCHSNETVKTAYSDSWPFHFHVTCLESCLYVTLSSSNTSSPVKMVPLCLQP